MDSEGLITAMPLQALQPTLAYVFREAERAGNLMLDRIEALGVPRGEGLGAFKEGRSIVTPDGRLITSDMVLSGVKPGRRIMVMGTCTGCTSLEGQPEAHDIDVLVVGGIQPEEDGLGGGEGKEEDASVRAAVEVAAAALGQLPVRLLGRTAAALGVRHVLLSRFDWKVHGRMAHPYMDVVVQRAVEQVADELSPQQRVTAIHDLWVHVLEKHEGPGWAPL